MPQDQSQDSPPPAAARQNIIAAAPRWAVIGIFVILTFAALLESRDFLMPLTMGVLLFFVFVPLRRRLERFGIAPAVTAGLVTSGLLGLIVALGVVLSGPAGNLLTAAPEITARLEVKFSGLRDTALKMRDVLEGIGEERSRRLANEPAVAAGAGALSMAAPENAPPPRPESGAEESLIDSVGGGNMVLSALSSTPALLGQIMFVLLLLFFLLASGDLLYLKVVQSFATLGQKRRAYLALRAIEDSLGSYLGTITIINACLGLVIGFAMWLWGMPVPVIFGVAAFILNYIPYVGLVIGTLLATAIALVTMDGFLTPFLIGATYAGISSIEGQLVTPYSLSRKLEMNTVVVFATVALWAWMWSVVGMVVAVPMLVVLRVICDHVPALQRLGNFLGGEDPPPLGPDLSAEAAPNPEAPNAGANAGLGLSR